MITGITRVLQRIGEIESGFQNIAAPFENAAPATVSSFEKTLAEEEKKRSVKAVDTKKKVEPAVKDAAAVKSFEKKTATASDAPSDIASIIRQSAAKYGVDERLVDAIAKHESNYRPDAVSEAGAIGVMQLMPSTAAGLGVENIYNPHENIDGGTRYLKELLDTFGGDVTKTVAAYNAGPQAVKAYGGVPPYAETQNYVEKVLGDYR